MADPKLVHETLQGKWDDETRPKALYKNWVSTDPKAYLPVILEGLKSPHKRVQSGCAELAALLSVDQPSLLIPYLELFVSNLEAQAPVLQWEAVCVLGNLASPQTEARLVSLLGQLLPFLSHKGPVLQGHALRALAKIAEVSEAAAPEIFDALTSSPERFPKNRIGFVIEVMEHFKNTPALRTKAIDFVEPYTQSAISIVAKKAKRTLKKLSK